MRKKSLFSELLQNESLNKDSYLFNIEHTRPSEELAFLKIEVFNNKMISIFKFKIQTYLDENLKKIQVGTSINKVGMLNLSNKNFFQLIKDGAESAIGEGRIPFLPK